MTNCFHHVDATVGIIAYLTKWSRGKKKDLEVKIKL